MKTIHSTLIVLLVSMSIGNCQLLETRDSIPSLDSYNYHMQKYETNKKTGKIFLITGAVSFTAGFVIILADIPDAFIDALFDGEGEAGNDLSSGLILGGLVAALASTPFLISANTHKNKAKLLLGTSQNSMINTNFKTPKNVGASLVIQLD